MTIRRISSLFGTAAIALAGIVLLAPAQLGGPTSYVVVDGVSMEPTYDDGDLVIARRRASYDVGDVVTFIAPADQAAPYRVIHRVVDATEDGFVVQGDNRDEIDPWIVTDHDILGASLLHIPAVGRFVRTPEDRALVLGIGAGLLVLSIGGAGVRRHRRRLRTGSRNRRRNRMITAQHTRSRDTTIAGPSWAAPALVMTLVAVVAAGWLAVTAFRTPPSTPAPLPSDTHVQHVDYTYTAHATPSVVYPEGDVGPVAANEEADPAGDEAADADPFTGGTRPPQILYSNLIDRLSVRIDHRVESDHEVDLSGEHRTYLVLTTADGWTSREPLGDPVAIEGATSSVERVVDLRSARSYLERVAELAGISLGSATVGLTSEIGLAGSIGGEPVEEWITETFEARFDSAVLRPTGDLARLHTIGEPAGEVAVPNRVAGMPVVAARVLGAAGLLVALLAAAGLAALVFLGWRRPEHEGIAARYGSFLVTVKDDPIRGAQPMQVGSMESLVRLAKREHTAILHEVRDGGSHRYVVPDGLMAFFYETRRPHRRYADDAPPRVEANGGRRVSRRRRAAAGRR